MLPIWQIVLIALACLIVVTTAITVPVLILRGNASTLQSFEVTDTSTDDSKAYIGTYVKVDDVDSLAVQSAVATLNFAWEQQDGDYYIAQFTNSNDSLRYGIFNKSAGTLLVWTDDVLDAGLTATDSPLTVLTTLPLGTDTIRDMLLTIS